MGFWNCGRAIAFWGGRGGWRSRSVSRSALPPIKMLRKLPESSNAGCERCRFPTGERSNCLETDRAAETLPLLAVKANKEQLVNGLEIGRSGFDSDSGAQHPQFQIKI